MLFADTELVSEEELYKSILNIPNILGKSETSSSFKSPVSKADSVCVSFVEKLYWLSEGLILAVI